MGSKTCFLGFQAGNENLVFGSENLFPWTKNLFHGSQNLHILCVLKCTDPKTRFSFPAWNPRKQVFGPMKHPVPWLCQNRHSVFVHLRLSCFFITLFDHILSTNINGGVQNKTMSPICWQLTIWQTCVDAFCLLGSRKIKKCPLSLT